jgi:hypothetical protein
MDDSAPMQHVNIGFTLENESEEELGDALALRYFEASFPDAQFRASCRECKAESHHLRGLQRKVGHQHRGTPTQRLQT